MANEPADFFVGARISEMPEPVVPSFKLSCGRCGEKIWASRTARREALTATEVICEVCFLEELDTRAPSTDLLGPNRIGVVG